MLSHDRGLPETVLEVLAEDPSEAAAGRVVHLDCRVEDDATPGTAEPEIELVVLVPDECLVETSEAHEHVGPECSEGNGVGFDARRPVMTCPQDTAERAVHGATDSAFRGRPALREEDAADVLGPALHGGERAPAEVVGGVTTVAVDPDDEIPRATARQRFRPLETQRAGLSSTVTCT
ncbi:MAG: hypothetical protein M5U27_16220 [Gaiella sp.]|nr:hypothetical protein [Gaiella sp.]